MCRPFFWWAHDSFIGLVHSSRLWIASELRNLLGHSNTALNLYRTSRHSSYPTEHKIQNPGNAEI
jgi:hypothetical protein